jgi:hypothetical protein
MDQPAPSKRIFILHIIFIGLILFGLGWTIMSSLTFFSNDIGLRFLQMRQLIAQQWQSFAIPYMRAVDPGFEHVPYYYAYSVVNGRLYFNITPFFPLMGSLLYAGLGIVGLVLSPIIGTILTAWGVTKLAHISQLPRPILAMWAAVFATPIIFYSLQLWDHSLGTGLAVLAVAWIAQGMKSQKRKETAVGGMLLGMSIGQRPELYLFLIAVGAAWLLTNFRQIKAIIALIGGGLVAALPLWLLQWRWFGHPLGMATATHLFGYGRPDSYPAASYSEVIITPAIKMGRLLFEIESRDPLTFSAAILAIVGLILLVFAVRVPKFQKTAVLWTGAILTVVGYAIWASVAWKSPITGLVSTTPFIALAVTIVDQSAENCRSHQAYLFVLLTAVLFITATLLIWPSFGGSQWGARYLLPAYPLLLILAFYAVHYHGLRLKRPLQTALQTIFILLLLTSVVQQFIGVRHLYVGQEEMVTARETLNALAADIVITNHPFMPSFLSAVDKNNFFFVDNDDELADLVNSFYVHDIRTIALLPIESGQLSLPQQVNDIVIQQIEPTLYYLEKNTSP